MIEINTKCPNCDEKAMSDLRKVTVPGVIISCKNCKAELGIESSMSAKNIIPGIAGLALLLMYSFDEPLKYIGVVLIILGGAWHLSSEKLIIKNIGPNPRKMS